MEIIKKIQAFLSYWYLKYLLVTELYMVEPWEKVVIRITMHSFPNCDKFPHRFATWVQLVGGKLETASDYEYYMKQKVCDIHFIDEHRNRCRRLNALAVPSLHINSGAGEVNLSQLHTPNQPTQVNAPAVPSVDVNSGAGEVASSQLLHPPDQPPEVQSLTSGSSIEAYTSARCGDFVLMEHNYSVAGNPKKSVSKRNHTSVYTAAVHTSIKSLSTKVKYLRSEICRLRKKSASFKARLDSAEKMFNNATFQHVIKNMTKSAQLFVHMQLQSPKHPKGRRFTTEEKILSLSLYKRSPKCYSLLCKYFTLPSIRAMKRLLSQIKINPGINPILFEKIKQTISKKKVSERICSLIFDEMSLTPHILYNSQKDQFEGFSTNNDSKFADHVLVFMVKGIKNNFKQPIAYYFTSCLKKAELKQLIRVVIAQALKSGLIVINTVCDQSAVNVGAITDLVSETKAAYMRQEKEWRHETFVVNGKEIIPIFDAPHLIKGIRNNLLTKDLMYKTNNNEKLVKWEYYQEVYAADKSYGELRLLDKITEEHVNPEKINKMRVKSATQIFSHSVAVVAEHLTARGDLREECRQLVDITLLIDNLFDSLNVSSLQIPNGKKYKGPIKKYSPHHELWQYAKEVLRTVKFIKKQNNGNKTRFIETNIPSITNLIKTIEGVEAIWQVLSVKYKYDCLLTRNLNQDPIENFFGNIRSYGVRNVAPNSVGFEGAYKALLLNNYSMPHSKRANCEDDANECLQNLKFFLTEDTNDEDIPIEENICINESLLEERNDISDAGQRNYVCGWILTKCLNKFKNCKFCRQNMTDPVSNNPNSDFIRAKEYNKTKKWLCYPSKGLENYFIESQTIIESFLNKDVTKKNIKRNILTFVDIFVKLPVQCPHHGEEFKMFFGNIMVNTIIHSWCRSINRILSGKITYIGQDKTKCDAQAYYNIRKHYKIKK